MNVGSQAETAIFGSVTVSEIYETEAEARDVGYYADAHLKTGAWPDTEWKILFDGKRFAAIHCHLTGMERKQVRRLIAPTLPAVDPPALVKPTEPAKPKPDQISIWDL